MTRRDLITSALADRRLHRRCSASPIRCSSPASRRSLFPTRPTAARSSATARSSARADRPGLPSRRRQALTRRQPVWPTALLPAAAVGHRLQRRRHLLHQPRARTQGRCATLFEENLAAYLKLERPYNPGLTAARRARRRRHDLRLRRRPAHLRRPTPRSRPAASPRCAGCRSTRVARAGRRQHRRPLPRLPRRARRERARAQPRPRRGGQLTAMTDAAPRVAVRRARSCAPAARRASRKLDPRVQVRNPVMFVVEIGAVITTVGWLIQVFGGEPLGGGDEPAWFTFTVAIWLWLTVVFANLAEALAEGRGKAQADALRAMRTETVARLRDGGEKPASELTARRRRRRRGGRADPRRRHRDRGHRLGRRVGDHRRVGARHPRVRRRPQRGHRRHARALRPHRRRDHAGARRELPRPHDRARRGRRRGARRRTRSRSTSCSPA